MYLVLGIYIGTYIGVGVMCLMQAGKEDRE
ncbi:DUF3789 domain-containing protein [Alkalibacterium subtropicum]